MEVGLHSQQKGAHMGIRVLRCETRHEQRVQYGQGRWFTVCKSGGSITAGVVVCKPSISRWGSPCRGSQANHQRRRLFSMQQIGFLFIVYTSFAQALIVVNDVSWHTVCCVEVYQCSLLRVKWSQMWLVKLKLNENVFVCYAGAEIINDNSNEEKTDTLDGHESTKNSDSKIDSLISEVDACIISEENPRSALEPPSDGTDLTDLGPYFKPTFNFAAYINKSPSLQELVKLGVDLHKLEHKKGVPEFILTLDFERDMKEHIRFLYDKGVPPSNLGWFLTKNPLIFKEDLDDLQVRINYLESKKFSVDMVSRVITKNPFWLSFSTDKIDSRLGHFQKNFFLTGNEVRALTIKQPRLITYSMNHIQVNTFVVKEELGFEAKEMKTLLLKQPKLWMISQRGLLERFEFVHNEMKIPHEQIVQFPRALCSRLFRIKQRHLFLHSLGRAQYNPTLENYISLGSLVDGTDAQFCENVAKTSVETLNVFLKTL
ncbi:hypothetical protein PR048_024079 [Dryococelus australis]|uniref:Transcription termination factor 3, mitochondrial n=1 Tax=Dryococelus australis TaxID=614101 RepID=A0ABQ9GVV7_9NEOP|nr:hypothetical protein PR048_024079 [Dryococelus australis]